MKRYDPKTIEPKWQAVWDETKLYAAADDNDPREKYYYLVEFPYPSGEGLHVGHVLSYTALDIMARHKRMQGYNVLYPMGFDEFGLPTENYAIKHKIAPQAATETNVQNYIRQLKSLGLSFDWDRMVRTSDPDYYKWTQWIFLQLYKAGLAYQDEIAINWCPLEKTGLANEEVVDGKHERCGTPVEKKLLKQWLLKITAYADRLIEDLGTVDYLDRISAQQINWIGKSEGAEIEFRLDGMSGDMSGDRSVTVYTTRPDTVFGATFIVVSPELAKSWIEAGWKASAEVAAYITKAINTSELERQEEKTKTGVDTGIQAIHPLSGKPVPVWVADYVLGSYGTGAIMAVPAHDARDNEFARKFELPVVPVIEPVTGTPQEDPEFRRSIVAVVRNPKTGEFLTVKWVPSGGGHYGFIGGGRDGDEDIIECAKREILEETGYKNIEYKSQTLRIHHHYYAHSKKVARQIEVFGVYFDLIDDERVEPKLEPDEVGQFEVQWLSQDEVEHHITEPLHRYVYDLYVHGRIYTGDGPLLQSGEFDGLNGDRARHAIISALVKKGVGRGATKYKLRDWVFSRQHYWGEPIPIVHCSKCGAVPVPEDQLPVELPKVEHYEPTDTGESPLAAITDWVNTACPQCDGKALRETDTMPNWAGSSWYYLRYMDAHNPQAFASAKSLEYWAQVDLYNGGMEHTTLHLLYSRFWHKFLFDQGLVPTSEPYAARRSHGMILGPDGAKMSKSKGNVINPDHVVEKYGADTIRLYEMFMGPFDEQKAWSEEHLSGVSRFIYRVWTLAQDLIEAPSQPIIAEVDGDQGAFELEVDRLGHKTLKKVHEDIGAMHFNTAVSALMEYVNFLNTPTTRARLLQAESTQVRERTVRLLVLMVAPFTPHLAEELWRDLGEEASVHAAAWPAYDPELIKDDLVEIAIQVNGKLRGAIVVAADATEDEVKDAAAAEPKVAKWLAEGKIVKTIVVPRRLVNFVVN